MFLGYFGHDMLRIDNHRYSRDACGYEKDFDGPERLSLFHDLTWASNWNPRIVQRAGLEQKHDKIMSFQLLWFTQQKTLDHKNPHFLHDPQFLFRLHPFGNDPLGGIHPQVLK